MNHEEKRLEELLRKKDKLKQREKALRADLKRRDNLEERKLAFAIGQMALTRISDPRVWRVLELLKPELAPGLRVRLEKRFMLPRVQEMQDDLPL
ncbi:hypothetical protein [Actomonas aquatica]|uniref:Mobilization protein n=1 Tax=Actomonas aquatica TaxID=2866162 RepID=A0ABZ1C2J5_9BACT|nr:hypothetical protein [Opitutus sp. WL0086]WRQ85552.1 hypothetical protein K1X11_012135 [Opitutus sp. WL0086]